MKNELAAAMTEEKFDGKGGLKIFYRTWRPAGAARAVVAICPGFNAHSGQYPWVGEQLMKAGFAVYALDLRGRGESEGERFFVADVADYVDDLARLIALAKSREPGLPVFLIGHSAGGVVSCSYALDRQKELAGLVCESFAFEVPAPNFAISLLKGLARVAPHLRVLKLKNRDFSRDPKAVEAMNNDPLIRNETQPAATVAALARADDRLRQSFGRITIPVFILHGTADKATKPSGSKFFHAKAGSRDKTLKLYDGHFHDLLNDIGKEGVLNDIKGWIEKRLPAANRG